jgi:REP element-mobilizing transposase RayT
MVLAYHVIFGVYGFWLPNDPRGSWSKFVGSWDLFRFGRASKTNDWRSLAGRSHDQELRRAAKQALQRPAVKFTGIQARAVGRGFAEAAARHGVAVWACSILPFHVHLVIGRHTWLVEDVVDAFKDAATRRLVEEGLHPFQGQRLKNAHEPSCWAHGQWKVFLNTGVDVRRSIGYVEENPEKEGLPRQRWSFVIAYHA